MTEDLGTRYLKAFLRCNMLFDVRCVCVQHVLHGYPYAEAATSNSPDQEMPVMRLFEAASVALCFSNFLNRAFFSKFAQSFYAFESLQLIV